jgi:hypothetical protein
MRLPSDVFWTEAHISISYTHSIHCYGIWVLRGVIIVSTNVSKLSALWISICIPTRKSSLDGGFLQLLRQGLDLEVLLLDDWLFLGLLGLFDELLGDLLWLKLFFLF